MFIRLTVFTDKSDNNKNKVCLLLKRLNVVDHVLDHMLDHILDYMLDYIIISLVTTTLQ